jgi:hypothetical protein
MGVLERWECQVCGWMLLPGDSKPKRAYHHTRGERCDGEWVKVKYVRADLHQGAVEERDALRAAIFPFLRLDHDIGDEWHDDCERARAAYGGQS